MLLDSQVIITNKGLGLLLQQITVLKSDELFLILENYLVATHFNVYRIIIRLVAEKIYTPVFKWLHQEIVTKIAFLNCEKNFADACKMLNWKNLAVSFQHILNSFGINDLSISFVIKEVMFIYVSTCRIVRYCILLDSAILSLN